MILDTEFQYFLLSFPKLCIEKSPNPKESGTAEDAGICS